MARRPKLEFNKRRLSGFSGNQLKMIACLLMLLDSIGFVLIENGMLYGHNPDYWALAIQSPLGARLYFLARVLRVLGRISFPIYAYLLVEGFQYTKNLRRYELRILLLALLSEVPFDLALRQTFFYPQYQNVCFTLFLGLCCMEMMQRARKLPLVVSLLIAGIFAACGWFVRADYGAEGIVLISVLWLLRQDHTPQLIAGALISAAESFRVWGISALSFVLLRFYNGKRGSAPLTVFFYLVYPLHFLVFYLMIYLGNR